MSLTAKQQAFCEEYLIDLNATQAAIRAGYSEKGAHVQGAQLLRNPKVGARIGELQAARSERTGVTADRVLAELEILGFSDIGEVVTWGAGGVVLRESEELDSRTRRMVESVSEGRDGIRVKLHSKIAALTKIAEHLGMFSDNLKPGESLSTLEIRRRDP